VAARKVGREDDAMLDRSSEKAARTCDYNGGRWGCRRRHDPSSCARGATALRKEEGRKVGRPILFKKNS
jgi:hypothetical protein